MRLSAAHPPGPYLGDKDAREIPPGQARTEGLSSWERVNGMSGFIRCRVWILVGLMSFGAISLALLPVWLGYRQSGPDEVFSSVGRDDEYVYLAWIQQAKEGRWLFNNPYTLESHRPLYFNPLFLLIGLVGRVLSLETFLVFNFFRVLVGVSLVVGVFLFFRSLINDDRWLLIGLFLAVFSGGLGYLSWSKPPVIRDFNDLFMASRASTEARFLPSILFYPQSPASVVMLLGLWLLFLRLRKRFVRSLAFLSIMIGNLLVGVHPYEAFLVLPISIGLVASELPIKRNDLFALATLGLSVAPVSLLFLAVINREPVYHAWTLIKQLSPPLVQWLVLYAPILPLSLAGLVAYLRGQRPVWLRREARLLLVWFILLPLLIYLPVNFQRRLAEGAYLPVSFLAVLGIWWLARRWGQTGIIVAAVLVILSLPDYPFQALQRFRALREDLKEGYYLPKKKEEAFVWLDLQTKNDSAVLTFPLDGLYVPAKSGNQVYLGHWANTIEMPQKWDRVVDAFWPASPSSVRRRLFQENKIEFFFAAKHPPSRVESLVIPWEDPFLRTVFENDQVAVFQVDQEG